MPPQVQPQVLCLSDEPERLLRGERRKTVLRDCGRCALSKEIQAKSLSFKFELLSLAAPRQIEQARLHSVCANIHN